MGLSWNPKWNPGINVTLSVCGLAVHPGGFLHGDESGLLTVPLDIADLLVVQARSVQEKERKTFEFLDSDSFSLDQLKLRMTH